MYQPVLLYTTEEHGCSLTTFYVRVEQHEPTLLMIKTCNNEVSNRFGIIKIELHWVMSVPLRYLAPIAPHAGSNATSKMTRARDRPTLAPAKPSCSPSIPNVPNTPGWASRVTAIWATARNFLWQRTPKWLQLAAGEWRNEKWKMKFNYNVHV